MLNSMEPRVHSGERVFADDAEVGHKLDKLVILPPCPGSAPKEHVNAPPRAPYAEVVETPLVDRPRATRDLVLQ
jgi:hypothetical protein